MNKNLNEDLKSNKVKLVKKKDQQLRKKPKKELVNLKHLIIDCLKIDKHPSHFNLEDVLYVRKHLKPQKTILTNLHYDLDYNYLLKKLPKDVTPAYDGLKLNL